MRGRSLSGYQRKRVWINDGFGNFTDVAQAVGATDTNDGRAVALADFRNTGVLDVVVANQRGPLLIYENRVAPGRHWIQFELEGTKSNRSAIGALERARAGAAGDGGDRIQRTKPTLVALRPRSSAHRRPSRDSLAFRTGADDCESVCGHQASRERTRWPVTRTRCPRRSRCPHRAGGC